MSASFDAYHIFYYVAKYGNLTRAANDLFLSQSTVTRAIQSLENELNCKLFERYPHGVSLTSEGTLLYEFVSRAHEQIINGENQLFKIQHQRAECLRIGVTEFTFSQYVLPSLISFCREFPMVQMEFCSQKSLQEDSVFSRLSEGKLDLLITVSPFPEMPIFAITELTRFSDIIVAGEQFSELRDVEVDLETLQKYPMISYADFGKTGDFHDRTFQLMGTTMFPKFRVDSGTYFNQIAIQGLALALLPEPLVRSSDRWKGLFTLKLNVPLPTRRVCAVISKEHTLSPAGMSLIRTIEHQIHANLSAKNND